MSHKTNSNNAFTLIELLIVIGIIAILASAVIVAINPGRQFQQARDATRERHLNTLNNALMSYSVDNLGVLTNLGLTETPTEICNTNLEPTPDCVAEGLIDLSVLVSENHINQLPIDPQGYYENEYGTGYLIAESSIILIAPKYEVRFIGIGITETEYTEGGEVGEISCSSFGLSEGEWIEVGENNNVVYCGLNDSVWTDTIETSIEWGCSGTLIGLTNLEEHLIDGETNTATIVSECNDPSFAAKACDDLTHAGHTTWYLPARAELREDFGNSACDGWSLTGLGENSCVLEDNWDTDFSSSIYWSSSEGSSYNGWRVLFNNGGLSSSYKTTSLRVRCRLGN